MLSVLGGLGSQVGGWCCRFLRTSALHRCSKIIVFSRVFCRLGSVMAVCGLGSGALKSLFSPSDSADSGFCFATVVVALSSEFPNIYGVVGTLLPVAGGLWR